jgi:hypothetical protein
MKSNGRKGRSRSTSNVTTASGEACAGITRSAAAGPGVKRKAENAIGAADVLTRETDMSVPRNQSNIEPETTVALSGSLHVTLIMQY